MLSREDAIHQIMNAHGEDAIYITSTGYISRAAYNKYPERKNIFYMQGSMGIAPCIGLGIALNTDSDVVVISGDAALLMHLGITHTISYRTAIFGKWHLGETYPSRRHTHHSKT